MLDNITEEYAKNNIYHIHITLKICRKSKVTLSMMHTKLSVVLDEGFMEMLK